MLIPKSFAQVKSGPKDTHISPWGLGGINVGYVTVVFVVLVGSVVAPSSGIVVPSSGGIVPSSTALSSGISIII